MRETLFRGKRIDNDEWALGDLLVESIGYKVAIRDRYTLEVLIVSPQTVGEYTGLKDQNGKRIFEGDIIEVDRIYDTPQPRPRRFEVEWEESSGFFPLTVYGDSGDYFIDTDHCEVIGNIYDNPELLEEKI